jgi:hypothetical protein
VNDYDAPTGRELCDAIRELLPHDSFELAAVRGYGINGVHGPGVAEDALVVRCRCGRMLRWPAGAYDPLPMSVLAYWLADHDDDMFLTDEQQRVKHEATVKPFAPVPDAGRPLLYDPDNTMRRRPAKEQT